MKLSYPLFVVAIAAAGAVGALTVACSSPQSGPVHRSLPARTGVAPPGPSIDWNLSPDSVASSCQVAIDSARARIASIMARAHHGALAFRELAAVDAVVADLDDALIAQIILAHVVDDQAMRDASTGCIDQHAAFQVDLSADPALYQLAKAAAASATTPVDKQLARVYIESGRRTGAGLDAARRAEVTGLFAQLDKLQSAYMRALGENPTAITISHDEAASLPPFFVATLQASPASPSNGKSGYIVPVHYGTMEQFLTSQASGEARKRYYHAFYNRGGQVNVARLEQALALRHRLAGLLGFSDWASYRLDGKMARTPERALALVNDIDRALLDRARTEIAALAAMKAASGDSSPFAAWDYPYYAEQLARQRYGVDASVIRQHFPLDHVVPAVLDLYSKLFGVTFRPILPARAWHPGVLAFAMSDSATGRPIAWFYLDLHPRPGKSLHYSYSRLRAGRVLPDGRRQRPISAIIGNGPPAEPGKSPLLSHRDVIIFFHEFGHLMHDTLSTAPYASLYGSNVRGDFVEAPSQMLENWIWQPSIMKKVSHHVVTGQSLPDDLIARMIALEHVADGAFWTRQAFFAIYDLTIHASGPAVDTTRLWFELAGRLTALPQAPGTIPQASFAGFMGGYDAGYYGYLWSKVYAQDMFSEFERAGLDNPVVGMRYRREVLEPGGSREPTDLLDRFLGRPVRLDAFYRALGLAP